ncbi:MAG: N-6 DNA methylase [Planctomycetaceae bacterium]|jgi:hypothetical protein|nr:N-6 DNA methylase [Planctomycetaceae bacterium]
MKLYAYTLPTVTEKNGWLKIGQTTGSVEDRIKAQLSQAHLKYEIVWQGNGLIGKREITDKEIHRCLISKGFEQDNNSEWFKCFPEDVEATLEALKEQYRKEDKREELSEKFYEELRNWYYWANAELKQGVLTRKPDPDYTIRIIIRLLLVFFLKEKELIPEILFDKKKFDKELKKNEHWYYKAILRNLFFHSLNTPMNNRDTLESSKLLQKCNVIKKHLHKNIPFLNGGIFNEHDGDDFALSNIYFFLDSYWTVAIPELGGYYPVRGIIEILSQYNYTLDETNNSECIDPEFIGKVFESLLACIDADTKETRRKITGSYYTPREIVNYMVNEALNTYLKTASTTNDENTLLRCTVFDPACGSGTFPCTVMNEIMRRIDFKKKLSQLERYKKKLEILRNVIYGVDIQPMAVQITILRLFLSLIQEIKPTKNVKENFGIEPLPNLDYKFVTADLLLGIDKYDLFFNEHLNEFDQILDLKREFFRENNIIEKEKLKNRIKKAENEIARKSKHKGIIALCQWNHSDTIPSSVFDPQWMFGVKLFDIIIGNPPYNVIESKDKKKEKYEEKYTELKSGRINIYQLFFGRAAELLSQKGSVVFIHPKTLLTDKYLSATRKFLLKKFPSFNVINIKTRKTTFSNVIQSVIISQWNKEGTTQDCQISEIATKYDFEKLQYLVKSKDDIVTKEGTLLICPQDKFYTIEKKIRSVPHFFLQFVTGSIEWNKVKKYLSSQPQIDFKRLIYGENIQRFCFAPSDKRIKTSFLSSEIKTPELQQLAVLTQRTTAVEQPYRIIATIIDPSKFDTPIVTENHTNVFLCRNRNTACFILGILNSRLMDLFFRFHNSNTQVSSGELNRLPIIKLPQEKQKTLIKLVEQRLNGNINVEAKINKLVYKLYGLTNEEQALIEKYVSDY